MLNLNNKTLCILSNLKIQPPYNYSPFLSRFIISFIPSHYAVCSGEKKKKLNIIRNMLRVTKSCPRVTHDVRSSPSLTPRKRPSASVLLALPHQPSSSAAPSPSHPALLLRGTEEKRTRTQEREQAQAQGRWRTLLQSPVISMVRLWIEAWLPGADRTGRGGFCVVFASVHVFDNECGPSTGVRLRLALRGS